MELAGNEKRIQALFSELSLEEAQRAPRFEKLWREALVAEQRPRFSKSLVVIAATVLVAVTVLFVAWPRDKSPAEQNARSVAPQTIESPAVPGAREGDRVAFVPRRPRSHTTHQRTLARHRQSDVALKQQAAMLANWKSPTETFVASPTRSVFNSLPQLNESAKDLQSFLQSTKESNQ